MKYECSSFIVFDSTHTFSTLSETKTERKKESKNFIAVHTSYFYGHPYSTQARVKVESPLLSLHLEE